MTQTDCRYQDLAWPARADTFAIPPSSPPTDNLGTHSQLQPSPRRADGSTFTSEWPFEPQLEPTPEPRASAVDLEESARRLSCPPQPAPIQLLWTPHGIISCNGEPVELYYPPNMNSSTLATSWPSHIEQEVPQNVNILHPDSGRPHPEPWAHPTSVHDETSVSDGSAMRDTDIPQAMMRSRRFLQPPQQDDPPPRHIPRDDLSDSLHSLTFDEPDPSAVGNVSQLALDLDEKPGYHDDIEEGLVPVFDGRSAHSKQPDSHSAAEGDVLDAKLLSDSATQINVNESTAINECPISGAVQRPELDYGRHRSSLRLPDKYESSQHPAEVVVEEGGITSSKQSRVRLEPLLSRLVQARSQLTMESPRASSQSGTLSPPPRASRTPYAPRKMTPKHTLRSQAPAPHTPTLRLRKPPVNHRLRAPDRHDQESVQLLQIAPSPPPPNANTDSSPLQKSTSPQPLELSQQNISDGKETVDYGSEDELLLQPDAPAERLAMATEIMSSIGGFGSRQTSVGPSRVVSISTEKARRLTRNQLTCRPQPYHLERLQLPTISRDCTHYHRPSSSGAQRLGQT